MSSEADLLTVREAAELLGSKNNILLVMHARPDGDTVGSAIALERILRRMGKRAFAVCDDELPERLQFILDYRAEQSGKLPQCEIPRRDLLRPENLPDDFTPLFTVTVDVASLSLTGAIGGRIAPDLKIDHHPPRESFARCSLVRECDSACGEIIYDLAKELGMLDREAGMAIYAAISSDSGSFRFSSVTAQTHKRTAELLMLGFDHSEVTERLYNQKTKSELVATRIAINNMKYFSGDTVAVTTFSKKELEENGLTRADTEGLNNMPIGIKNTKIGIVIKEDSDPGFYKLSVRTGKDFEANTICERFGGGGHIRAAGGRFTADSMEGAVEAVLSALRDICGIAL